MEGGDATQRTGFGAVVCGAEQHRELVSEGAEAPGWLYAIQSFEMAYCEPN